MKAIAVGVFSTLNGLSAELVGRSHGGGVLKPEPGEMAQLPLPRNPGGKLTEKFNRI